MEIFGFKTQRVSGRARGTDKMPDQIDVRKITGWSDMDQAQAEAHKKVLNANTYMSGMWVPAADTAEEDTQYSITAFDEGERQEKQEFLVRNTMRALARKYCKGCQGSSVKHKKALAVASQICWNLAICLATDIWVEGKAEDAKIPDRAFIDMHANVSVERL